MTRFGMMCRLKPEGATAYIRYHATVTRVRPMVVAKIRECHIQNCSIYHKDG